MSLRLASGRLSPGQVSTLRGEIGPHRSEHPVRIALASRLSTGFAYRSARVLVDGIEQHRCQVERYEFVCDFVLLPDVRFVLEVRVFTDASDPSAPAVQRVRMTADGVDQRLTVTNEVDEVRDPASTFAAFSGVFPGAFLPLLALLLLALAATVAERRRRTGTTSARPPRQPSLSSEEPHDPQF